MNLRFLFAMAVSKCVYYGMRLLGRQASYLPGWFAVKLCPDYLRHIRKAETVICVTGTDGKLAALLHDPVRSGYLFDGFSAICWRPPGVPWPTTALAATPNSALLRP